MPLCSTVAIWALEHIKCFFFNKMKDQNAHKEVAQLRQRIARDCKPAILETTVDAIMTIDSHGIVQSFNAATKSFFGYRAEGVN